MRIARPGAVGPPRSQAPRGASTYVGGRAPLGTIPHSGSPRRADGPPVGRRGAVESRRPARGAYRGATDGDCPFSGGLAHGARPPRRRTPREGTGTRPELAEGWARRSRPRRTPSTRSPRGPDGSAGNGRTLALPPRANCER